MTPRILLLATCAILSISGCDGFGVTDETSPRVSITTPSDDAILISSITIEAEAADNDEVEKVEFFVDSVRLGEDNTEPYTMFWNVSYWADNEVHSLFAMAMDASGNVGVSDTLSVLVPRQAAPVPSLMKPRDMSILTDIDEVEFLWRPFTGTLDYEINVSSSADFPVMEFSMITSDSSVTVTDLPQGHHYWRIRGRNRDGKWSGWSDRDGAERRFYFYRKATTFGGMYSERGASARQTSDGGFIIVGVTNSFGSGMGDIWLIKTDAQGSEEWSRTFGGSQWDRGYSVEETDDGGYILCGYTSSTGAGGDDVWLIKTDGQGNESWSKTFGGSAKDRSYSVQQTSDGGFVIAGATHSGADIYGQAFLIKTDPAGTEEWRGVFGGEAGERANSVKQTSDGGYILTGYTYSYGQGGSNVWLIKTDTNGNETWNRTFGGGGDDEGYAVEQTTDGGFIITGKTHMENAAGAWLIKTDGQGNEEWNKRYGLTRWDGYPYSGGQTTDGGYILLTTKLRYYRIGDGWDLTSHELWFIKTDAMGSTEWTKSFGGYGDDWGYSVSQTSDHGYIITGYTESFEVEGKDLFLIKTDPKGNVEF